MNTAVFRIAVFATVVTMTTSTMITQTIDMVTVRLGEAIHLSCDITLTATESVSEVRWYRGSSFILYGSIDVQRTGCPTAFPCPEGTTTDNRDTIRYEIGTSNVPVLTLTINSSTLEDNGIFRCGIAKGGGTSQTSSGVFVTVYVPEAATPIPGHQTPLGTTTTESTTDSPDTTTVDGSISSHQSPTTSNGDTASTTRLTTGGPVLTTTPIITVTTSGKTPSTVPTSIQPDPRSSSLMTTVVTTMTTVLTSAPGGTGPPVNTTIIIAVAVSACVVVVVIVILLVIIARLSSSRRRYNNEPTLLNLTAPVTTDNQDAEHLHVYEGTLRRTRQPPDVERSTNQQSQPVYATPSTRRKPCNDAPQNVAQTRPPGQRGQYEDPEINAVEPGPDKAGYPSSEPPKGKPPGYARIDPHSRPSSAVESGNVYTAVDMAGRHDRTDEPTRDEGVARPDAEISHYATPKPVRGAAGDRAATGNQDAGIPEHPAPEYATLDPHAGVGDDESGTWHEEAGNLEHSSPEYDVLNPDTAATDHGDDEDLPTDAVYAQPFRTM